MLKKKETDEKDKEKEKEKETKPEPTFEILSNPARVTPSQLQHISFDVDPRYVPIVPTQDLGIVILKDTKPDEKEELVEITKVDTTSVEEKEPEAPEPFVFLG